MPQLKIASVNIRGSVAYGAAPNKLISIPCVEIVCSDNSVFKGDAILTEEKPLPPATWPQLTAGLSDALKGRDITNYFDLCLLVKLATYVTVEMRIPDPSEKSADEQVKDNRREVLSRLGVVEKTEPTPVPTDVTYPLHRSVIRGATEALLHATAYAKGISTRVYLSKLISGSDTEGSRSKLNLGLDVDFAEYSTLLPYVSALTYSIPAGAGAKSLGKEVEKFQRYLRQLNSWINDNWEQIAPEDRPSLFVDLNGAVHRLNKESNGKTLGSLVGFGTTGNQEKMIFTNVVTNSNALRSANDQALMQSMVQSRKQKVTLAAGCWTNTVENVQTWLEKCKPKMVVLKLNETPDLSELIEMINAVHSADKSLVLLGNRPGTERSWAMMHDIASASHPFFYLPAGGVMGFVQVVNR